MSTNPQQPNPYGAPPPGYGSQPGVPQPGYGSQPGVPQPGYAPPPGYAPQPGAPQPGYPAAPAYGQYPGAAPMGNPGAYASWGQRVGAYLIDELIAMIPMAIAYPIAFATAVSSVSNYGENSVSGMATFGGIGLLALFIGYGATLGIQIWNRWIKQGTTGQSIGKKVLGIRLISQQTGQPVGAGIAFVRDLAHICDSFFCIGYLFPLWDPMRQTFADKIMTTVVVPA